MQIERGLPCNIVCCNFDGKESRLISQLPGFFSNSFLSFKGWLQKRNYVPTSKILLKATIIKWQNQTQARTEQYLLTECSIIFWIKIHWKSFLQYYRPFSTRWTKGAMKVIFIRQMFKYFSFNEPNLSFIQAWEEKKNPFNSGIFFLFSLLKSKVLSMHILNIH